MNFPWGSPGAVCLLVLRRLHRSHIPSPYSLFLQLRHSLPSVHLTPFCFTQETLILCKCHVEGPEMPHEQGRPLALSQENRRTSDECWDLPTNSSKYERAGGGSGGGQRSGGEGEGRVRGLGSAPESTHSLPRPDVPKLQLVLKLQPCP